MPYVQNVEQLNKTNYADNVIMVAQQMKDPLIGAVTVVPVSGEAVRVADLINAKRYGRQSLRSRVNGENPTTATARWLVMPEEEIFSAQYIDKADKWKMANDPTSNFMKADVAAVTRGYTDTVMGLQETDTGTYEVAYGGLLGIAREGKSPGVGTPLPAGQILAAAGLGLTLDKLRTARKMMKIANFGIDQVMDPLYGAITPEQEDNLLGIAAASGANLNTFEIEQLKEGKPTRLLGITWIVTNRLPKAANIRTCVLWSKANIIVGEWEPINGQMWPDPHVNNLPYIKTCTTIDAVRAQDKGVVAILCQEP
ncbi:phage capsid protein [Rhodoferax sp.]|uniref:phage capsid protein n=1 Tax=Rhodoferax sp. TaxID=50421 RepID=UPI002ACEAF88|nr:phage capsid protein [Rhodoferax sp.]MDZ7919980.1 phage capsid protein [Rhodoferax sp.]